MQLSAVLFRFLILCELCSIPEDGAGAHFRMGDGIQNDTPGKQIVTLQQCGEMSTWHKCCRLRLLQIRSKIWAFDMLGMPCCFMVQELGTEKLNSRDKLVFR